RGSVADNMRLQGRKTMAIRTLRGVSALALVIGAFAPGALAQEGGPQTGPDTISAAEDCDPNRAGVQTGAECSTERVVVTGSNIVGAAESAALPVEVYTADGNFKSGNQTTLDFIKTLSVVGSTVGETNQFQAGYGGIGASSLN